MKKLAWMGRKELNYKRKNSSKRVFQSFPGLNEPLISLIWCENVWWGHTSAQRLLLRGMDHFPTLKIESESNCVLPWLITGWEDRPSQQHNSVWAKYLYWGGTTSLIHNTFIHIRDGYFQSFVGEEHHLFSLILKFSEEDFFDQLRTQWATSVLFSGWFSLCIRLGAIRPVVSELLFTLLWLL